MSDPHICFEAIQFSAVTPKGFSDVSILTAGEALGHGVVIDERTIEQFIAATLGKTLPAYLTHGGAQGDRLGNEIGMFSGFYRDGMKVRANFRFLQSFIDHERDEYATLTELAKAYPDQLGISPVVRITRVWTLADGSEVDAVDDQKPEGATGNMPAMRVLGVKSCDFVKTPAANTALFAAKVDEKPASNSPSMANETIALAAHNEALAAKTAEIAALSTKHTADLAALEAKHVEVVAALNAKVTEAEAIIKKAGEDKTSLEAALAAKTKEADEAKQYDMRKAGAPALQVALQTHVDSKLPAPGKTDREKWAQFAELEASDPKLAAQFQAKFMSRR